MYKHVLIVLAFPLTSAAEAPKEDAVKAELKNLEGVWKVVLAERDGEKLSADQLKTLKITIAGDRISIKDTRSDDRATIKIDLSQKPTAIDFQPVDDEKSALGMYTWSGDRLKLCWGKAGGVRPKEFATRHDSEMVLFELEREK